MLKDGFGRRIDYLRLSITDRCNLRCLYCMPRGGVAHIPHGQIMRYEEILKLVDIFLGLGIRKIRVTGGEPLLRKDALHLFRLLGRDARIEVLTLTTNGLLLAPAVPALVSSGIRRINVSLDTLDADRYRRVTFGGDVREVIAGIERARRGGLGVKINTVAMRGVNDDEFPDIVAFAVSRGCGIRFIEMMPQLYGGDRLERYFVSAEEVLRTLSSRYAMTPRRSSESTTESLYALEGCGKTALGIISAMSEPFCHRCNKVRLLPDGSLRTCLYGGSGINLKDLLRSGASPSSIVREIRSMVAEKPWSMSREPEKLAMHRTGG